MSIPMSEFGCIQGKLKFNDFKQNKLSFYLKWVFFKLFSNETVNDLKIYTCISLY